MTTSRKYAVAYNAAIGPVEIDSMTGTQLLPQQFAAVQRSQVQSHINDGTLIVVDETTIGDESMRGARDALAEYQRLTAEWEKEKSASTSEPADAAADYDDSASKKTAASKSSSKTN